MIDWEKVARAHLPRLREQVLDAIDRSDRGWISPGTVADDLGVTRRQVERQVEKLRAKDLVGPPAPSTTEERFWAFVDVTDDDCWHWTGFVRDDGYASFSVGHERIYAHRFAYELLVGPIPEGMDVDHTCHNADASCAGGFECRHRSCVRPEHLEPVSHAVNIARGRTPEVQRARHQRNRLDRESTPSTKAAA